MALVTWTTGSGNPATQIRRLIRAAIGLHSTFKDEVWLWRGEANSAHRLEPGMHTRLRRSTKVPHDEAAIRTATDWLIGAARRHGLDRAEDVALPDLALLASLQHHGAATPLLDVTVDPLVALWMVANSSGDNVNGEDDVPGRLIAIRRPPPRRWIDAFDARPYIGRSSSISSLLGADGIHWYRPPEISERLRIQRGSFVLGAFDTAGDDTSLHLKAHPEPGEEGWLDDRITNLGKAGKPVRAATDVVVLDVKPSLKAELRDWLTDRAGLSRSVIFPTPWHRPNLEAFARTYGRGRSLDDD